jgi:aryl-alcohol dehydrogenase-like predicted oxidoreductase
MTRTLGSSGLEVSAIGLGCISHGLLHGVALSGPQPSVQLRVQRLELVLDFGPGLAADPLG